MKLLDNTYPWLHNKQMNYPIQARNRWEEEDDDDQ